MKQQTEVVPQPPAYITKEGAQRLRDELDFLWRVKRPTVTKAVSAAAALGDRSENAEYIYGKKQLREIDKRVRYLRKRLDAIKVVAELPGDRSKIFFGAWVTLQDENDRELQVRIVGTDEFVPAKNWISVASPLAKALLRREVDDEVELQLPGGNKFYVVVAIDYDGDASQPFIEPQWV